MQHLTSHQIWRTIAGFLVGVLFDVLALFLIGAGKLPQEPLLIWRWLEFIALPPIGFVMLLSLLAHTSDILNEFIVKIAITLAFALYPMAFAACFALPWKEKTKISVVATAAIFLGLAAIGYAGLSS